MCLIRNSLVWVILDPTNHTYHNQCTSKRHSCVQGPLWKRFRAGRFRAILLLRTIFMHSQLHLLLRVLKTHHNHWIKQMVNTWLTQRIEGVSGVLATINKNKKTAHHSVSYAFLISREGLMWQCYKHLDANKQTTVLWWSLHSWAFAEE